MMFWYFDWFVRLWGFGTIYYLGGFGAFGQVWVNLVFLSVGR